MALAQIPSDMYGGITVNTRTTYGGYYGTTAILTNPLPPAPTTNEEDRIVPTDDGNGGTTTGPVCTTCHNNPPVQTGQSGGGGGGSTSLGTVGPVTLPLEGQIKLCWPCIVFWLMVAYVALTTKRKR